jgi:hypothetical protein
MLYLRCRLGDATVSQAKSRPERRLFFSGEFDYASNLRRITPNNPSAPLPIRSKLDGSGVAVA